VQGHYEVDVLRTTLVRDVMTTPVHTIPPTATLAEARARFDATRHGAYPIVDERGACVGIVSRRDLLWPEQAEEALVGDLAGADVVTVAPSDSVLVALHRMLEESVEHVPVVGDDGRLLGICTRTDVLGARRSQLEHERSQPGWRRRGGQRREGASQA
jgi:CBS domain-containing protein